jgi:hypothetical protein
MGLRHIFSIDYLTAEGASNVLTLFELSTPQVDLSSTFNRTQQRSGIHDLGRIEVVELDILISVILVI